MAVALCGGRLGRLARHGRGAWWDDDGRLGMALADAGGDAVLVVRAVACDGGHCACDLVEQGANLRAVIPIVAGERRGDDPARVGIHPDVHLAPGPARLLVPCFSTSHSPAPH